MRSFGKITVKQSTLHSRNWRKHSRWRQLKLRNFPPYVTTYISHGTGEESIENLISWSTGVLSQIDSQRSVNDTGTGTNLKPLGFYVYWLRTRPSLRDRYTLCRYGKTRFTLLLYFLVHTYGYSRPGMSQEWVRVSMGPDEIHPGTQPKTVTTLLSPGSETSESLKYLWKKTNSSTRSIVRTGSSDPMVYVPTFSTRTRFPDPVCTASSYHSVGVPPSRETSSYDTPQNDDEKSSSSRYSEPQV